MDTTASVSVLIVSYGNYSGLEYTVKSVLKQSYPIREIILSDDGSKKPFPKHILGLFKVAPCEVIIREGTTNLGTTAHLNYIANMSHGTYLKFLAAGDAFASENSLKELVTFAQQWNTAVISSNTEVCSQNLKKKYYEFPGLARGSNLKCSGDQQFRILAKSNIISAVGTLFHRDFFEEQGGFDESYRLLEDWPTWLRLSKKGDAIPFLDCVTCLQALGGVSTRKCDAYQSEVLRTDMIRCYEQEILPEISRFKKIEQRKIRYRYEELTGRNARILWVRYFDLHLQVKIKRKIKTWIIQNGNS